MTGERPALNPVAEILQATGYHVIGVVQARRDGYTVALADRTEAHSVARKIVNEFEADPEACQAVTIRIAGHRVEVSIEP